MKLSYEDYRTMANLLVCHMRRMEEQATQGNKKWVLGLFVVTVGLELVQVLKSWNPQGSVYMYEN